MEPERVRKRQCDSGDERRETPSEPQAHQEEHICYRHCRRDCGDKVDFVSKFAGRFVLDADSQQVKEGMGKRKTEGAFNIVVPDAVLDQPAVLPQQPGGATDDVKRKGSAKKNRVVQSQFWFRRVHRCIVRSLNALQRRKARAVLDLRDGDGQSLVTDIELEEPRPLVRRFGFEHFLYGLSVLR